MSVKFSDNVNNPSHYCSNKSGIEAITVCEHMNFNLGNAMKYIWRSEHKGNQVEDLQKSIWYLNREIQRLKRSRVAPIEEHLARFVAADED